MEQRNTPKGLIIGLVVVGLAIAGAVVYALQNQPSSSEQDLSQSGAARTGSEDAPAPTSGQNEAVTINFTDQGFEPSSVTVKQGTTVTIKNNSSRDVQFSSDDHPTHRDNTEMNLSTIAPGESDSYFATTPGTWGYHDHLDESKTGTVTVTE